MFLLVTKVSFELDEQHKPVYLLIQPVDISLCLVRVAFICPLYKKVDY